jgi:RNA polymerase sigma-70 factor (ECF subfamily)
MLVLSPEGTVEIRGRANPLALTVPKLFRSGRIDTRPPAETDELARADRELVSRAQSGDSRAFEELIRLHSPRLIRMLVRLVGSSADAEEVAQEALLKAWRALPKFRGEAQFSTWLYRIAVNEGKRKLSHEARRRTLPIDDVVDDVPDLAEGPPALAESAELEAYLDRCIAELPAHYRAAVVLRDVEGLTNEEAADILGLELRNFKSRLHRGRMAIRRRLEDFYGEQAPPPRFRLRPHRRA